MLKPFFIRHKKVLKRIDPRQVMALSTEKNYTKVVFSDKSYYLIRSSLASAIKKLPPDMFVRINRSEVASIYYIDDIDRYNLFIGGAKGYIGKGFYKGFISKLTIME
ncbi:MAG TPA: LytTR family DNA-binding domain-containing protein [Puia sp.]|jgi:DNA-binding LytR/AlgR family response regulator|nr:LytTR family DNA-binding domain-containing protein [Puia sp.]